MGCSSSTESPSHENYGTGKSTDHTKNGKVYSGRKRSQKNINNNAKPRLPIVDTFDEEKDTLHISSKLEVEEMLGVLEEGELFCDPDFPPDYSALYCSPGHSTDHITWLRPKDLVKHGEIPELMVDGITRDDIKQGLLGDCWFLSSCAAVSQHESSMKKVLSSNQPLSGPDYKGVVCFNFWQFGEWVPVYIDDRLPCMDGKLIYGQSSDAREFWVALIEKAYAKLHGSYEAIEGGVTMDALVDLTGGVVERYEVSEFNPGLYHIISQAHHSGAFIVCAKQGDWRNNKNAEANGLVSGHAYTIIDVTIIQHDMGEEKLLRLRNPYGDSTEWRGSWSDNDVNWQWVDEDTKQKINLESRDDGEFWMSFPDFCHHFQEVTICLRTLDMDVIGINEIVRHVKTLKGQWVVGESAGGSRNNLELFATNPQFLLHFHEADNFTINMDNTDSDDKCTVTISLMQELCRTSRSKKPKSFQIGFSIYKSSTPDKKLPARHFRYNPDCGKNGVYINFREVSGRFELDPSTYIIIPSTFNPNCAASFMVRVCAEKPFSLSGPLPS